MSHWNPSSSGEDPSWVESSPGDPDSTLYPAPDGAPVPYNAPPYEPPEHEQPPYEQPPYEQAQHEQAQYGRGQYGQAQYGQPDSYQQPPIWARPQAPAAPPMWDDPQPPKAYLRQQPAPPGPGRRGRAVIIVTAAVVIIAAVGALAYELQSHRAHSQAGPATAASTHASQAQRQQSSPTGSPSAGRTSPRPSRSPRASPGNATVAVAHSAARNPLAPQVVNLLTKYFTAINTHNYPAYLRLLDPQMQRTETAQRFSNGFRSTTDSRATLTGLSTAPDGRLAAVVRFTSHQSPADSPDGSACTHWTITLYLTSGDGGYLIGMPPAGYQASHQTC